MQVQLAVYDLSRGMAMAMSQSILGRRIDGIWHTGIVVFSREYYFGGGIQVAPQGAFAMSHQMPPVQMLDMGTTTKTQAELGAYLRSINHLFTQFTYNLITNNCNNFADNICNFLTGHGIPEHIVDLPRIVFSTPGGAMLRPMIEGMQNNIGRQNGAGLDPFGGDARAAPPQSFEASLSDSVQSVGLNMARNASQPIQVTGAIGAVSPAKASLEEQALVSGDASTVGIIGRKILNLPGPDGVAGTALAEQEKSMINSVLTELGNAKTAVKPLAAGEKPAVLFPVEAYALFERVLAEHPAAHMSCLFILRLMLLHDRANEFDKLNIVEEILRRLLTHARSEGGLSDCASTADGFSTVPAHVLAICAISNLLSHDAGADYLLHGGAKAGDSPSDNDVHLSNLIDIALSGLSHARPEVRQMSATLAYNYTLLCTRENRLSGVWRNSGSTLDTGKVDIDNGPATPKPEFELNPHALQLLCGCLEGLLQESDSSTRRRRLAVICRILRAFGNSAVQLVNELGFHDQLLVLYTDKDITPKLTKEEREILAEINHVFAVVH